MKDYTQVERDNAAATIEDAANNLQEAINMAIAALREKQQRQPDPDTGLVPCGCGGKAQMGKLLYTGNDPDLMPGLMTEYYAYCQDCGITTDNSTDMERVENEWNTAMGYPAPLDIVQVLRQNGVEVEP